MVRAVHSKRKLFSNPREQKENTPQLQQVDSSPPKPNETEQEQKSSNITPHQSRGISSPAPSHPRPSSLHTKHPNSIVVTPQRRLTASSLTHSNNSPVGAVVASDACVGGGASGGSHGRPYSMPMSERQQIALLMQMASTPNKCLNSSPGNTSVCSPRCSSPNTPRGAASGAAAESGTPTLTPTSRCVGKRNERGETPLHVAAIRGDAERVHHLIQRGSDVNAVDYAGWTALHEACNRGFVSVAKELIAAGASVNAKGLDNDTPLHDAAVNNHFKLVELLLESGASTNVVNRCGQTPADVCRSSIILSLLQKAQTHQSLDRGSCPTSSTEGSMSRRTPPNNSNTAGNGAGKMDKNEGSITNKDIKDKEEESASNTSEDVNTSSASAVSSASSNSTVNTTTSGNSPAGPSSPRVTLRLQPQHSARTPEKRTADNKSVTENSSSADDPYEFKCSKDDTTNNSSREGGTPIPTGGDGAAADGGEVSASSAGASKRPSEQQEGATEDDELNKRKRRKDEGVDSSSGGGSNNSKSANRSIRLTGEKGSKPMSRPSTSSSNTSQSTFSSGSNKISTSSSSNTSVVNTSVTSSGSVTTSASSTDRKSPLTSCSSNSPKAVIKQEKMEEGSDEETDVNTSTSTAASTVSSMSSASPAAGTGGPKVPPLKIVLSSCSSASNSNAASQEQETSTPASKSGNSKHLPYVVPASQQPEKEESNSRVSSPTDNNNASSSGSPNSSSAVNIKEEPSSPGGGNSGVEKSGAAPRITRSQRGGSNSGTSDESQPAASAVKSEVKAEVKNEDLSGVPSTSTTSTTTASTSSSSNESVHPRKRKLNIKEEEPSEPPQVLPPEQPLSNCYQMFQKIRRQIDDRRKLLFPVQPKPPQGFKDYLMNRGSYVLARDPAASAVPKMNPPQTLTSQPLKDLFTEQENDRYKLRLQHQVERERLVLSVEQEILRVHGRAARALANQVLPFSACTMLRDQEVYNILTPEQEEKHRNARSRYNGRLFISWLQDVDDKWEKIKESMVHRQQHEAESLNAVHRMHWEWKLKELGLCDNKSKPVIEEHHVPMVAVSDFDLLPA